jgi:hypothetical protein
LRDFWIATRLAFTIAVQPFVERDPGAREVLGAREHPRPHGVEVGDRRVDEVEHDIDVVNHEVEHDARLDRAETERVDPVALDENRVLDVRQRSDHHGVEPLNVPHLERHAALSRETIERLRLSETARHRLFDEDGDARLDQARRDSVMRWRRRHDAGRLRARDQLWRQLEVVRHSERCADLLGLLRVRVDHPHEPSAAQLPIDARVLLPEVANPHDEDVHWLIRCWPFRAVH